MSSGLHFDSLEDCPPGLRKLVERQMAKERDVPDINDGNKKHFRDATKMIGLPQEKEPKRKYRNTPTERLLPNGECIKFGSKKEAAYYDNLMLLEKAGTVRNVKLQYQFLLKPAYTDAYTGERFRAISYLADFVFERLEDGKWREVVIDTKGGGRKGTETKTFILKRKLLAEQGVIIETA
jgi:hypothetical protein